MIPSILSLFLLFLTEAEAFFCIKAMIDVSREYLKEKFGNDLKEMRWYFTMEPKEFVQMCGIFFEGVQAKNSDFKSILKHFTKIGFEFLDLFQMWAISLYLSHLPLSVILNFFH